MWEFCQERLNEYTALFFASDFYASDAVFIFQSQGIRVPQDISVVGFDDNLFAEHCRPMLTTVLVFYVLCQKWIISGVVTGAVKQ